MNSRNVFVTLILSTVFVTSLQAEESRQVVPLPQAHSHNDYRHSRPLHDALDHGFCSIEADVFLINNLLYIGHERHELIKENNLEALYLKPLMERCQQNDGYVYPNKTPVILWIDFKTKAETTYAALEKLLDNYADILTTFENSTIHPKAVTVILTGSCPGFETFQNSQMKRYATLSGGFNHLNADFGQDVQYAICENWNKICSWRGEGDISSDQLERLREIVDKSHQLGRKVRFWNVPPKESVWQVLVDLNVDFINTDDLERLQAFLLEKRVQK